MSLGISSPVKLGSLQLRNRNWMSALTRNRSVPTSVPNDANVEYYTQRANGGAGLIVSEGVLIRQQGTEWPHAPGLWSDEHVAGWKKVINAVHEQGGAIFAQLWHVGRVSHPDMPEQKAAGIPVFAPSAISARGGKFRELPGTPGYVKPTAVEDPTTLIKEFRHAAEQAKKAGFDGVELHGANGYLVHQFLDSTSNHRTDQWGGSVENRIRFAVDTLKELIAVFGADRVAIKLSPGGGYNDMGMPLEDTLATFKAIVKEAVNLKVAYITLVRASPPSPTPSNPGEALDPTLPNPGTYHDVLASYGPLIKREGSSSLLVLNLDLTAEEGNTLIKENKIDAASYGRPWINNPDFQHRVEQKVPLATDMNWFGLYNFKEQPSEGYSDYPAATA